VVAHVELLNEMLGNWKFEEWVKVVVQ
jgi:hypothetical protein